LKTLKAIQSDAKRLPEGLKVGGILKHIRQYDIIQDFLTGELSIDGTVEMSYENYRMGSVGVMYKKDEIYNRVARKGDIVTLAPAKKEAPANQDGVKMRTARCKAASLTEI
jgi:hypothetical protein